MNFRDLNADSLKLNILLYGRTMSAMQEFLCSMNENMSKELPQGGMAYYTTELQAISDIVDKKKKLERFFWEFSKNDWTCPANQELNKIYTFSISPAGTQDKTLDFVVHCCCYNAAGAVSAQQADAVWYLADAPVLDANVGYDAYRDFLKGALGSLPASSGSAEKPVCLLLSQIEKDGHFGGVRDECLLKPNVSKLLLSRCRELFSGNAPVAVIPVQVYGGLEYVGTDENGNPTLRLSDGGFYQSYIPENCQIPGLYTLWEIARIRQTDFFAGASCGGMRKVIFQHFARKKGAGGWKPDMLREVTGA